MTKTNISQKEQFEDLITSMVNSWLDMKMIEHDYDKEMIAPEANRFFNMPLRSIYSLVAKNFIEAPPGEAPVLVLEKDTVIKYLQSYNTRYEATRQEHYLEKRAGILIDIPEKTDIRNWIVAKEELKQISVRLFNILYENSSHLDYLEDIDKWSFLRCRNAGEKTWKEFVTLRGF